MMSESMTSHENMTGEHPPMLQIESSVGKLLSTTKKLLETLTLWSSQKANDKDVYEQYSRLEIHFASASQAFESLLLPMDNMLHLPDELYQCLKDTLINEPSGATLEQHLPFIRDIILKLLQGLKQKQSLLRSSFDHKPNEPIPLPSPSSSSELLHSGHLFIPEVPTSPMTTLSSSRDSLIGKDNMISLYIKKDDSVKKINVDRSDIQSFDKIQLLFETKFGASGEIYILDQKSNIEYELEDVNDIQPYSILSLKSEEYKEFKNLFKETLSSVLQQKNKENQKKNTIENERLKHELASLQKEFKQYKEQFKLQSDTEINEIKTMTKNAAIIITNRLEQLHDLIDQLKLDVTQKRCRPSKIQLNYCKTESQQIDADLSQLSNRLLKELKPHWKKSWEVQLQSIVKEQQFLKEQEGLLVDLKDDYKSMTAVLDQLYKIAQLQENRVILFKPPSSTADLNYDHVIKQVQTIQVDHDKRVQALQEAEKQRSKELSSRIDEFEKELTSFVGLSKLKRTEGGISSVDKKRQEKNENLIKQIFVVATKE